MYCHQLPRTLGLVLATAVTGCAGDLSLPTDGAPARIAVISGDGQEAIAGDTVPAPLKVQLTDAADRPVAHVPLVFGFTEVPDGEVFPAAISTDSGGFAAVQVRLGTAIGTQTVEARVDPAAAPDLRATFDLRALKEHGRGGGGGGGEEDKHKDKGAGHHPGD